MTIGNTIKQLRLTHNLSQEVLAEQLGVSRQTISNWENGRTVPALDYMKKLSEEYQLSLDQLLHLETNGRGKAKLSKRLLFYLSFLFGFLFLLPFSESSLSSLVLFFTAVVIVFASWDLARLLFKEVVLWHSRRKKL
ncbi:TPA: helix-turn-helix transcriptional regulator [Streptococcus suis]|uniref:SPBc2 prophage-derived HTH-type transcriptional regulator yonR n=1 Tax=Streptococcus suis TaxID=1307 RepID=A0AAN2UT03_STRSU|nr:helix-turn-helix transcriptional regulator [Streptococcus suis]MCQ9224201.1 helix-turn-helix transcriptional regulator [Streptococcus suis]MCQ9230946.1 helix-turn-helix transcriptional regulator [Streptococcus suis]NQH00504.1 helix-turn-helix transcriptional regulator [Streptococcus suis]NQH74875.1 helix-turn-helix transcriptional regulator [Streptococcus suis]NQO67011.1 helix-turn-helix transcriptional regulator [Streptococcus suis]